MGTSVLILPPPFSLPRPFFLRRKNIESDLNIAQGNKLMGKGVSILNLKEWLVLQNLPHLKNKIIKNEL